MQQTGDNVLELLILTNRNMFKFKVTYIHNGTITSNILENDCIELLFKHGNVKPNNLDHYIILEKVYRIAKVKL